MSNIERSNGSLKVISNCSFDNDQIERLVSATERIGEKMDIITAQHKDIVRWLLIVVCAIALGQRLTDAAKDIWGSQAKPFTVETK